MSKGTITAVTPVKHGADPDFLRALVTGLSGNDKVVCWAVACHPDDAPMVAALGARYGIETTIVEEYGTNVARLRNLLLSFVSTRYFVQADADDMYRARALDLLAMSMDNYPGAGGAFGLCTDFDSDTDEALFTTPAAWMDFPEGIAFPGELAVRRRTIGRSAGHFPVPPYPQHPGAGIFATDTVPLTGGYPEHDGGNFWDDVEHLARVNKILPVLMNPDITVMHYRKYPGSITATEATGKRWASVAKRLHSIESGAPIK